jgi:hypothetical protein
MMNTSDLASQGDPHKIADLIVQSATQDDVPLRLTLDVNAEKSDR